jgi:hypothetical protein
MKWDGRGGKKIGEKHDIYVWTIKHTPTAPCNLKAVHGEAHRHMSVEDYHQQLNYIKTGKMRTSS